MPRPLLLLVAVLLLLPACGWRSEPVGPEVDGFPVQVADAAGDQVTVSTEPEVVVSLDPDATVTMRALGYDGRIVEIGDPADEQALRAAGADLVIAPLELPDDAEARVARAAGAPVFRYGAVSYDDAPRVVARLALAIGRGPEGVELARTLGEELQASLRRAEEAGPTRVFIDGGGLFTALGPESPYGQLLATVGAESVVPRTSTLRFSALERADPDAWVLTPASDTSFEELRDPESPLTPIRAVAEGRIFPLELSRFGVTPNLPKAIDELVSALHAPPVPLPPPPETVDSGTTDTGAESGTGTAAGTGTGAG